MKKILVTGGTVFVSRYVAEYFKDKYEVYVLNRNTRKQVDDVHLIQADRHRLGGVLKGYSFDIVIDVCAYNKEDIVDLIQAIHPVQDYIMISSSAVYPENNKQPFLEEQEVGYNAIWKDYGINKVEAEQALLSYYPHAYILRPPYLYGPMQNIYREPFVFDCALLHRPFYIPDDGQMKLQFFHVEDLCRIIEIIIEKHPHDHIFNVGNEETIDINTFVELCYDVVGEPLEKKYIHDHNNQRDYFPFYRYEYVLDVTKQKKLLYHTKDLKVGLKESFDYYIKHQDDVIKKDFIHFIDENFK